MPADAKRTGMTRHAEAVRPWADFGEVLMRAACPRDCPVEVDAVG